MEGESAPPESLYNQNLWLRINEEYINVAPLLLLLPSPNLMLFMEFEVKELGLQL